MNDRRLEDHPLYPWARRLQRLRGRDLMRRHGAHGLHVGWIDQPGDQAVPGLIFHLPPGESPEATPVPATIPVSDDQGEAHVIPTGVMRSDPPMFE